MEPIGVIVGLGTFMKRWKAACNAGLYENIENTYNNNEILINAEEILITIRPYLL